METGNNATGQETIKRITKIQFKKNKNTDLTKAVQNLYSENQSIVGKKKEDLINGKTSHVHGS